PLFVNPANHHFQLSENSPAIDAGDPNTSEMGFPLDGNNEPIDILGNPRFFGNAIDIGAYEWNNNLSANEVSETSLEVVVYPNPTKNYVHIQSQHPVDQIQLYDIFGKEQFAITAINNTTNTET